MLRGDAQGLSEELWAKVLVEAHVSGLLSYVTDDGQHVRLGNVRECERVEPISQLGVMSNVIRVQWRGKGSTYFSAQTREETAEWIQILAQLHTGDDESIIQHIATLVHDTSYSAGMCVWVYAFVPLACITLRCNILHTALGLESTVFKVKTFLSKLGA